MVKYHLEKKLVKEHNVSKNNRFIYLVRNFLHLVKIMVEVGLTKMSTKGQIVIPSDLRSEFSVGEKLFIIKNKDQLIIKKASKLDKTLKEDLEFAKRTEAAWKRYGEGKFVEADFDEFINDLKKC